MNAFAEGHATEPFTVGTNTDWILIVWLEKGAVPLATIHGFRNEEAARRAGTQWAAQATSARYAVLERLLR